VPLLDLWFSPLVALLELLNPLIIFKSLGDEKQENELEREDLLSTGLADPPARSMATAPE
jgi:hypothetical protein